ncbi:protein of unknown function [Tenacibaculum sp. 190524A02b]|uniref:Uncharacterized protein n=1 Tax=Tenacibaculum vairaonense TaxID=3137860 RepID=A0ABP1F9J2_9FLAO
MVLQKTPNRKREIPIFIKITYGTNRQTNSRTIRFYSKTLCGTLRRAIRTS